MTAATLTPADFLTARYDEREALARVVAALPPVYDYDDTPVSAASYLAYQEGGDREVHDWIVMTAETTPVLADVKADRAILALHQPQPWDGSANAERVPEGAPSCATCGDQGWDAVPWPCDTVRLLVSKYATHPGCRAEWLP